MTSAKSSVWGPGPGVHRDPPRHDRRAGGLLPTPVRTGSGVAGLRNVRTLSARRSPGATPTYRATPKSANPPSGGCR